MTETIVTSLAAICITIGTLFSLLCAVGLYRLPDVYSRAHAASKASTLGVMFIMLGVILFFISRNHSFQPSLLLAIVFIFITGPIGGHLIMRSAYHTKTPYTSSTVRDDLKDAK